MRACRGLIENNRWKVPIVPRMRTYLCFECQRGSGGDMCEWKSRPTFTCGKSGRSLEAQTVPSCTTSLSFVLCEGLTPCSPEIKASSKPIHRFFDCPNGTNTQDDVTATCQHKKQPCHPAWPLMQVYSAARCRPVRVHKSLCHRMSLPS